MVTTSESYRFLTQDLTRTLTRTAREPQVERETAYYLDNIGNIKSVDDFLKDDRIYRYALKAFGLSERAFAKAFFKKVLTEGIDQRSSFANRLADPRYRELVRTFNFARNGELATSTTDAQQGTVDRFVRQTLEENAGQQNEGVRLALYFSRKAPELQSTIGILADKALLKVVQTALNIPEATSLLDIDKQVELYSKRINVQDFQDPKKLSAFITRFTTLYELQNPRSTSSTLSPASLVVGGSGSFGVSSSVLASINNLKLGGF